MSKIFNPKAWYLVGVGAAALAADGVRRLVKKRRAEAGSAKITPPSVERIAVPSTPPAPTPAKPRPTTDDLTEIKGIGPVFARRLAEAGITTFSDIANASPDRLREVTNAPAVADPEEWIAQARLRQ